MTTNKVFKCVLLGASGVGKTSIVTRLTSKEFNIYAEPTMGAAFSIKNYVINHVPTKMEIWDTAGQERFSSMVKLYYRKAHIIIVVYDITDDDSFIRAKNLIKDVVINGDNQMYVILVANKCDRKNSTSNVVINQKINENIEDGKLYAQHNDIMYVETSAKIGIGINELDQTIIDIIEKKLMKPPEVTINGSVNDIGDVVKIEPVDESKSKSRIKKLFCCLKL